eukprot:g1737.t1
MSSGWFCSGAKKKAAAANQAAKRANKVAADERKKAAAANWRADRANKVAADERKKAAAANWRADRANKVAADERRKAAAANQAAKRAAASESNAKKAAADERKKAAAANQAAKRAAASESNAKKVAADAQKKATAAVQAAETRAAAAEKAAADTQKKATAAVQAAETRAAAAEKAAADAQKKATAAVQAAETRAATAEKAVAAAQSEADAAVNAANERAAAAERVAAAARSNCPVKRKISRAKPQEKPRGLVFSDNVCVSPTDKSSGTFRLSSATKVSTITFTHKSGHIGCEGGGSSKFGCGDYASLVLIKKGDHANPDPVLPARDTKNIQKYDLNCASSCRMTRAGNPRNDKNPTLKPTCSPVEDKYSVRCCSKNGKDKVPMSKYGSCSTRKTFKEARQICERNDLRLCTVPEIEACKTCGTGCGFDGHRIWTSSSDEAAMKEDEKKRAAVTGMKDPCQCGLSMDGCDHTGWWYQAAGMTKISNTLTWNVDGKKVLEAGEYEIQSKNEQTSSGKVCYDLKIKGESSKASAIDECWERDGDLESCAKTKDPQGRQPKVQIRGG